MKWKRLGCFVIIAALVCGLCGCGGSGSSGMSGGSGSSGGSESSPDSESAAPKELPTSKAAYHAAAESFAGGSGTAADPYQISTAEELALLSKVMGDEEKKNYEYQEACYVLTADIALNDVSDFDNWGEAEPAYRWLPVERFTGTFDGARHTISGLYLFTAGEQYTETGLFGSVDPGGVVKDLHLTQVYLFKDGTDSALSDAGCLAGDVFEATIENCTVEGMVHLQNGGSLDVGGIVGKALYATISGCSFSGTIDAQAFGGFLGGIVGSAGGYEEDCLLSDCVSEGSLRLTDSTQANAGGVVAFTGEGCVMRGCVNRMDLSGEAEALGGVMGTVSVSYISKRDVEGTANGSFAAYDCRNEGAVENLAGGAGGVIGNVFNRDPRVDNLTLSGLTNSGSVSGMENVGGVIGEMYSGYLLYTVQDCLNQGTVGGERYVGGIIGYLRSCVDGCRIMGCANSGAVTSASPTGGIVGGYMGMMQLDGPEGLLTIADCRNEGTVENLDGISGTGGILGEIFMDNEEEAVLITNCENEGTVRSEGFAWMGGIVGGSGLVTLGGSWTVRNCKNSGALSFGSGTRDFAADASPETEALKSAAVDPATMDESDYQASLAERVIHTMGGSCVGGIVGKLCRGTIEDCAAGGSILLDGEGACFAGGICGQFYNVGGANGSSIRNCQYRREWPFPAMAGVGTLENLPEDAMVNVTASLEEP